MIPRIIHQTVKNLEIPPQWVSFQAVARELHHNWEYRLWTDADNLSLMAESAVRWMHLYESLPRNIMRADMIRYVILQKYGGLYLDLDYELFRPFDLLEESLVLPSESDPGEEIILGNCILASEPGHPFWECALTELEKSFSALGRRVLEDDVLWITGPGLLTRTYKEYFLFDRSIRVPPRNTFHPRTPRNDQEYNAVRAIAGVYGVHHCAGTWRARSLTQRVARKITTSLVGLQEGLKKPSSRGNTK
ncbi:MAG: glycosyltransferase [Spirochaetia bacterium]|jgi:mannosyltransferase OCH1-like enzyme